MGTDIVLAIGYGTYKLTAEDTKACLMWTGP